MMVKRAWAVSSFWGLVLFLSMARRRRPPQCESCRGSCTLLGWAMNTLQKCFKSHLGILEFFLVLFRYPLGRSGTASDLCCIAGEATTLFTSRAVFLSATTSTAFQAAPHWHLHFCGLSLFFARAFEGDGSPTSSSLAPCIAVTFSSEAMEEETREFDDTI